MYYTNLIIFYFFVTYLFSLLFGLFNFEISK